MTTLVRAKWGKVFRALLAKVHARTRRFSSSEIERDITVASRKAHKR